MKEDIIAAEQAAATAKSLSEVGPPSVAGSSLTAAAVTAGEAINSRIGRYRWAICGLLFFATTINYVDRQVLGLLSKDLQAALHWTELDYGNIVAAFNAAYASRLLAAGRLMDRFGTKIGYSVALSVWSLAAMGHALAVRRLLRSRAGRPGSRRGREFSGSNQDCSRVVSQKGTRPGNRIFQLGLECRRHCPHRSPSRTLPQHFGWQWAFIITGAIGWCGSLLDTDLCATRVTSASQESRARLHPE